MNYRITYILSAVLICSILLTPLQINAQESELSLDSFKQQLIGQNGISSETIMSVLLESPEILNKVLKNPTNT